MARNVQKINSTYSKYCVNGEQLDLCHGTRHLWGPDREVVHGLETSKSWLTSTLLVKSKKRLCKLHLCKMVWQPLVVVAMGKLQLPGEIHTSALGGLAEVTESDKGWTLRWTLKFVSNAERADFFPVCSVRAVLPSLHFCRHLSGSPPDYLCRVNHLYTWWGFCL